MKWEFTSSIIPFFSKLAPSDIFKLTKRGRQFTKYFLVTSLRLDSNFVGIKKFRAKYRNMSLIYNPLENQT